jgi:hypothetical protein
MTMRQPLLLKLPRLAKSRPLLMLTLLLCPLTATLQPIQPTMPLLLRQKLRPPSLTQRQPLNRQQRRHPQLIQ